MVRKNLFAFIISLAGIASCGTVSDPYEEPEPQTCLFEARDETGRVTHLYRQTPCPDLKMIDTELKCTQWRVGDGDGVLIAEMPDGQTGTLIGCQPDADKDPLNPTIPVVECRGLHIYAYEFSH